MNKPTSTHSLDESIVSQVVSMPIPSNIARLHESIQKLRKTDPRPLVLHVVYQNCSCTRNLLEHLAKRGPESARQEILIYVGSQDSRSNLAENVGFDVRYTDRDSIKTTYAIEAAPLLLVTDKNGQIRYLGGYYRTPATVRPMDQEIVHKVLITGQDAEILPLYGCAISKELQDQLDPLQLQQWGR